MRYIIYTFVLLFITTGCVRNIRMIPIGENNVTKNNQSKPSGRLYDVTQSEGRHKLKAEPFSLNSKKKDPELLGPQRTLNEYSADKPTPKPNTHAKMSKSECISIIGQAKFDRYAKRFGGDAGAIRRCVILKRLRG